MRREVVTIQEGMRIDGLSLSLYLSTVLLPLCLTCTGTCTMWMGLFLTKKSQKKIKKLIISELLIRLVLSWNFYIIYPESSKTKYSVWKPCWLCVGWSASIITGRTPGQLDIYLCSLLPDWHLIRYLPFLIWYEPG